MLLAACAYCDCFGKSELALNNDSRPPTFPLSLASQAHHTSFNFLPLICLARMVFPMSSRAYTTFFHEAWQSLSSHACIAAESLLEGVGYCCSIFCRITNPSPSIYDCELIVNPRRACAARVTVLLLCVCLSVCLWSFQLTLRWLFRS